ncbi:MAG: hypothetical protein CBC34_007950 [Hyphomicrobiaceae bacterium TMED74]|nr:hypothetical protein [Filomicrobium sp.]RPG42399.1 MAG: hypothetical protein CBC34_007950 [Hyphomicrobiaceae bacterium TMED74]
MEFTTETEAAMPKPAIMETPMSICIALRSEPVSTETKPAAMKTAMPEPAMTETTAATKTYFRYGSAGIRKRLRV